VTLSCDEFITVGIGFGVEEEGGGGGTPETEVAAEPGQCK
jgi:hypothetical protein